MWEEETLVVVAHPDDEAFFFTPTISKLQRPSLLCLSTGNAYGLGARREKEFVNACRALGIPKHKITILDALPDGQSNQWDPLEIAILIEEHLKHSQVRQLVTFDHMGVSGHPNHVAVFRGVQRLLARGHIHLHAYMLRSERLHRRFIGPLAIAVAYISLVLAPLLFAFLSSLPLIIVNHIHSPIPISLTCNDRANECHCAANISSWPCHKAMREYETQYVWYRRLHVLFASVTYCNVLVPFSHRSSEGQ